MTVKGVLNAIWQFCRYLFWPQWGSTRRRAQEEYERMLEEGSTINCDRIADIMDGFSESPSGK